MVKVFEYGDNIVGQKLARWRREPGVCERRGEIGGTVQIDPRHSPRRVEPGTGPHDARAGERGFAEGSFDGELSSYTVASNDQLTDAKDYQHSSHRKRTAFPSS